MKKIEIRDEFITMQQFLKIADIIASGGEAKIFLATNEVLLNSEKEDRRGKKLYKGDVITVLGAEYQIC